MSWNDGKLDLGNPFDIELFISGKELSTGSIEPATGLSIESRICEENDVTSADPAIHDALIVDLTAGAASGGYMRYYGAMDPAALLQHLQDYVGEFLWVISKGPAGTYRNARRFLVTQSEYGAVAPAAP